MANRWFSSPSILITHACMSLVIAGERSGVGKTTVTLALLAALKRRRQQVQSFKVGPDYIDPMFHRHVTGRACRNLDPLLTSERYIQRCFAQHTQLVDSALVEGVMGLFDGAAGQEDFASTAHVARSLNLPILLVIDCSRLSHSVAALVHGYRSFDPRIHLVGVVLNRVGSDRHLELLKSALKPLQLPILGVLRRQESITIPDRHLGLVPTAELADLNALIDQLADLAETCFDWPQLLPLLQVEPAAIAPLFPIPAPMTQGIRVAIAQDAAFSFYYTDNLDLLESLGAELIPWSPLTDPELPPAVQGLYFGGGFPEMFAAQLAANTSARKAVQVAIQAGMPTYAECGGLMYLCQEITDFSGNPFPMVAVLPATAVMEKRLTLGYRQVKALQDSVLLPKASVIWGHEFHRSQLSQKPESALFSVLPTGQAAVPDDEGWTIHNLHASYVHLHWGATPEIPQRFLHHCREFATNQ